MQKILAFLGQDRLVLRVSDVKRLLGWALGKNLVLFASDLRIDQTLKVLLIIDDQQLVLHRFLSQKGTEGLNLRKGRGFQHDRRFKRCELLLSDR